MGVGPIGFSVEEQNLMWSMRRAGESIREMERTLGETVPPRIRRFLRQSGGIAPIPRHRRADHLTLADREGDLTWDRLRLVGTVDRRAHQSGTVATSSSTTAMTG